VRYRNYLNYIYYIAKVTNLIVPRGHYVDDGMLATLPDSGVDKLGISIDRTVTLPTLPNYLT